MTERSSSATSRDSGAAMRLLGERNWYLPRWLAPAVHRRRAAGGPVTTCARPSRTDFKGDLT
jgi:hypothetical protein